MSWGKPEPWDYLLRLQHGDDEQGDVVQVDTSQSEDDDDLSNFDEAPADLLSAWLGPRQPGRLKGQPHTHPLLRPWLGPDASPADASPCVAAASPCVEEASSSSGVGAASPCVADAVPCAAHASPMDSFVNLALLVSPPSRKRLSSKTTVMAALGGTQVVAPAPPLCSSAKPKGALGGSYARLHAGRRCAAGKRTRLSIADVVRNSKGSLVSRRKSDIGKHAKSAPQFGSYGAAREVVRKAHGFGNSAIGGKTARGQEFHRLTLLERDRMIVVGNSVDGEE